MRCGQHLLFLGSFLCILGSFLKVKVTECGKFLGFAKLSNTFLLLEIPNNFWAWGMGGER